VLFKNVLQLGKLHFSCTRTSLAVYYLIRSYVSSVPAWWIWRWQ